MASNYKNSAGTDLDNLFYTSNTNAGAVKFLQADSKDLGNKYTNLSTLGYAVGYKNSAGTDLGNLRGATHITKPTGTISIDSSNYKMGRYSDYDGESYYSMLKVFGSFTINIISSSQIDSIQYIITGYGLKCPYECGGDASSTCKGYAWINLAFDTSYSEPKSTPEGYDSCSDSQSDRYSIKTITKTTTSKSCVVGAQSRTSPYYSDYAAYFYIRVILTNSVGSTTLTTTFS